MNKLYVTTLDGTYKEIGEPVEINDILAPDDVKEYPKISLSDGNEFTFTIRLPRGDKKLWGRIFQIPRYKVTEWMFPKKKKRGSIRRARVNRGE